MKSVLIADDSTSMRQMVSFTLKTAGYQVEESADGLEAFEKAQANHFDLVITDVNMPKKNGVELVRDLRSLANYKHIPILLLTTESAAEKKQEGRAAGATGWLTKPFNPDTLIKTVSKVLS